jgi:hypothetical protein
MVFIFVPVLSSKSEADATASLSGPRPAANYTFGDSGASTYSSESSSKQMRKILRSPSAEREPAGTKCISTPQSSNEGASKCEVVIVMHLVNIEMVTLSETTNLFDQMNVDSSNERQSPRMNTQRVDDINHNSRRQSIAVGH